MEKELSTTLSLPFGLTLLKGIINCNLIVQIPSLLDKIKDVEIYTT